VLAGMASEDVDLEGDGDAGGSEPLSVLPGDDLTEDVGRLLDAAVASASSSSAAAAPAVLKLGAGLLQRGDRVLATKAGVLSFRAPNRFFVLSNHKRYAPAVGDTVVGVVVDRLSEAYRVRLHGTTTAQLPLLAFDGATKRNKPNLEVRRRQVGFRGCLSGAATVLGCLSEPLFCLVRARAAQAGAVVFARVAACSRHMEPELSCQGAPRSGGWVRREGAVTARRGAHTARPHAAFPLSRQRAQARLGDGAERLWRAQGRAAAGGVVGARAAAAGARVRGARRLRRGGAL
jgi:hypothetical protein